MDPLSGVRPPMSDPAAAAGRTGRAAAAKVAGQHIPTWDRRTYVHLLVLLLAALALGCSVFVGFFGRPELPISRYVFLATAAACVILGILHALWVADRWRTNRNLYKELGLTLAAMAAVAVGLFLMHGLVPAFFPGAAGGAAVFGWIMAATAVLLPLPWMLSWCFDAAIGFQARRYRLWYYPKEMPEIVSDRWNPDRVILANLHFKRRPHERARTTMNVRLPLEAKLGDVVYLFIEEHNKVKSPNDPIQELRRDDGSLGWLFLSKRYLMPKQRSVVLSRRYLDPELTIAENRMDRYADIFFERVDQPRIS